MAWRRHTHPYPSPRSSTPFIFIDMQHCPHPDMLHTHSGRALFGALVAKDARNGLLAQRLVNCTEEPDG